MIIAKLVGILALLAPCAACVDAADAGRGGAGGTASAHGGNGGPGAGAAGGLGTGGAPADADGGIGGGPVGAGGAPDAGDAGGGDPCPPPLPPCDGDRKLCGNSCVSLTNPFTGCAGASCGSCKRSHTVMGLCSPQGACTIDACYPGWGDCNMSANDGCEADLRYSAANCGACGKACAAGQICAEGACVPACAPPLTDCGGTCVDLTSSPEHCGGCNKACAKSGIPSCAAGGCSYAPLPAGCPPGLSDCNGACVDLQTDPAHCGACSKTCLISGDYTGSCRGGECTTCPPGLVLEDVGEWGDPIWWCVDHGCGCAAGKMCSAGACTAAASLVLATAVSAKSLAVDDNNLYFTGVDGTVGSVPKAGGPVTVLATGQSKPTSVVVNKTALFWSNKLGGAIMTLPLAGGSPSVLAPATESTAVVADDLLVAWINSDGTVRSVPAAGGPVTTLYTMTEPDKWPPVLLAMNSTSVVTASEAALFQIPRAGGPATHLGLWNEMSSLKALAVDERFAYVTERDWNGGGLTFLHQRVSLPDLDRGDFVTCPGSDGSSLSLLHVEANDIYCHAGNTLYRASLCPSKAMQPTFPRVVSPNVAAIAEAWDDTYYYWSDGGTIRRLVK